MCPFRGVARQGYVTVPVSTGESARYRKRRGGANDLVSRSVTAFSSRDCECSVIWLGELSDERRKELTPNLTPGSRPEKAVLREAFAKESGMELPVSNNDKRE